MIPSRKEPKDITWVHSSPAECAKPIKSVIESSVRGRRHRLHQTRTIPLLRLALVGTPCQPPTALHPLMIMIIRQRGTLLPWLLLPLLLISVANSQSDANCHPSIGDDAYDFSTLSGDHTVSRTRLSPPTNMTDMLRFNVCGEISPLGDVNSGDQVRVQTILKAPFWMIRAVSQRDMGLSYQDECQTRGIRQSCCRCSHCAGTRVAGRIHQAVMCVFRHHCSGTIFISSSHQRHGGSK